MSEAIRTVGLVKRYGIPGPWRTGRSAVSGLNLRIPTGGITGLLGPNGAGKTTTVKLLFGVTRPTDGTATVLGRDSVRQSLEIRREAAVVPEARAILGWIRVADFIARVAALADGWDAGVASRLARRWQIDGRLRLGELSAGARSRLLLLVALARRPALLVLDEPTTGLDPSAIEDTLSEVAIAAADGATVLLVTHRLEEVERICDRVVVMTQGRDVLQEDLDDLRSRWRSIDVAGHPAPEKLQTWEEVASVSAYGEHLRLLVRTAPEAVIERVRMLGAEVTGVRPVSLREIYLSTTRADLSDAPHHDLA